MWFDSYPSRLQPRPVCDDAYVSGVPISVGVRAVSPGFRVCKKILVAAVVLELDLLAKSPERV